MFKKIGDLNPIINIINITDELIDSNATKVAMEEMLDAVKETVKTGIPQVKQTEKN